jgi:hypothetical protein
MGPSRRAAAVGAALLALLVGLAAPAPAGEETIGSVKNVAGAASVLRGSDSLPARPGLRLHVGDMLETGPDGSLGVILRDDALISLGPSSRVGIEKFLFAPAEGRLGLTARVLRGTLAYISGLIGRLAPESASFVTPVATIGARGTHLAVKVAE